MGFDAIESSADQGRPVELYEFVRGGVTRWRYTSADAEVEWNFHTWEPALLQRGGIERTREINRSGLRIQCARDFAIADLYRVTPPSDPVNLTVRRIHLSDDDSEGVVFWMGRVVNVEWSGSEAVLICEPVTQSLKRPGLRMTWQRQCPHVLYGPACQVNAEDFDFDTTVASISGASITVDSDDGKADGYYAGGFLQWESSADVYERRFIRSHVGNVLTVSVAPTGLTAGASVRLFPGCDHTTATCLAKFDNLDNYGGIPFLPTKNPFGTDPVY